MMTCPTISVEDNERLEMEEKQYRIQTVQKMVAEHYLIPIAIMRSRSRSFEYHAWPRMVAMATCAMLGIGTTTEIADMFERERTSVTHAVKTFLNEVGARRDEAVALYRRIAEELSIEVA